MANAYVKRNLEHEGIEIYFAEKPSSLVIDELKKNRWRWFPKKYCWYHFYSEANYKFANKICDDVNNSREIDNIFRSIAENAPQVPRSVGKQVQPKEEKHVCPFQKGEYVNFKLKDGSMQLGIIKKIDDSGDTADIRFHFLSRKNGEKKDMNLVAFRIPWKYILKHSSSIPDSVRRAAGGSVCTTPEITVYEKYGLLRGDPVIFTAHDGNPAAGKIESIFSIREVEVVYSCGCDNQVHIKRGRYPADELTIDISQKAYGVNIHARDFVVRSAAFKCMHQNHELRDIAAIVGINDKAGRKRYVRVPAGYCPDCGIYFILESTYKNLRLKGTLFCRVSDEKNYIKSGGNLSGMQLAPESLLMQYGYNVSQEENLLPEERRNILSSLVDEKIMTRTEIVSYLDFFIKQRMFQSSSQRYQKAIEKWDSDRRFISDYKTESCRQYIVRSISRQ